MSKEIKLDERSISEMLKLKSSVKGKPRTKIKSKDKEKDKDYESFCPKNS